MATKSIGATGRDYATLALWAAYVNALSLSAPEIGEMYNDAEFTFAAAVTLGGWTGASGTNTVTLKAAAGHSFKDHADKLTNPLRYNVSKGVGLRSSLAYTNMLEVTGTYFRMDGLQFFTDQASCAHTFIDYVNSGVNEYSDCIFQSDSNRNVACFVGNGVLGKNLLAIVQRDTRGFQTIGASEWTGCMAVHVGTPVLYPGWLNSYATGAVVKNCVSYGFVDDYLGTASATSTNNATDKGSFGGTNWGANGQTSIVGATEWESITLGSEDFRLKSTSAKLKDNGATAGSAVDIVGTSRPQGSAYDIGCWEYTSGGGGGGSDDGRAVHSGSTFLLL